MACHSELAYNQSLQVLEMYTSPLAGLEEKLQHSIAKLEGLKQVYDEPVNTVVKIINDTANKVEQIRRELQTYEEVRRAVLNPPPLRKPRLKSFL